MNYLSLNAILNLYDNGRIQIEKDKEAARSYFLEHVNQNTVFFHDLEEKFKYLLDNEYYEEEFISQYSFEDIKSLFKKAYDYKFRFESFMGAYKFFTAYALKTFDGKRYLERFEDRVCIVSLVLARGDISFANKLVDEIIMGRFQPATPTFLNAGKKSRGEFVSCFLIRTEDNMESIGRTINSALHLSKIGGGVAICLSNIRERGAPIKKLEGKASSIVPIMKILEDSFSYANQLGARQGAGAVYLNAHHPDILDFLDTKRENADEKIRIKSLSLGIVIPDITFELAKNNEEMFLFSPYSIYKELGKPFSEISITEEYYNLVNNDNIKKSKINARDLLKRIAEIQMESGYPYIMFEDTVNKANPIEGRISMSNLCSEILQVNSASTYNKDLSYKEIGDDISCNLGSINICKAIEGRNIKETIEIAIRGLTSVSELSNIENVPSITKRNSETHAIGLGQMNLHGFLAKNKIHYGSEEALDFVNVYFSTILFHCLKSSNKLAFESGKSFKGFENSKYASGEYFNQFINDYDSMNPKTQKIKDLLINYNFNIPSKNDWILLREDVKRFGLYNQYLQAIPPTGSISYINNSTASIHPITTLIEIRKEGQLGRVYYPAPYLNDEIKEYYKDAYEIGYEKIIDTYAIATKYVDQGLSCTLFFDDKITTRTLNKAQIYAWKKGLKTLYYVRFRQNALEGTEIEGCVSCSL